MTIISAEEAKDRVVYFETDALEGNEQSIRDLAETVLALYKERDRMWLIVEWAAERRCTISGARPEDCEKESKTICASMPCTARRWMKGGPQ